MEIKKLLNSVVGNVNWFTQYGKDDEGSSRKDYLMIQQSDFWTYPRRKLSTKRIMHY